MFASPVCGKSAVLLILAVLAMDVTSIGAASARQKKPYFDESRCDCTCRLGTGSNGAGVGPIVSYNNTFGSCGVYNNNACSVEVQQQGVNLIRTGTLEGCGIHINEDAARGRLRYTTPSRR